MKLQFLNWFDEVWLRCVFRDSNIFYKNSLHSDFLDKDNFCNLVVGSFKKKNKKYDDQWIARFADV